MIDLETTLTTENEAKAKVCPQTFCQPGQYGLSGEVIAEPGPHPCIGSACMAWRWTSHYVYKYKESGSEQTGYCGMAGNPAVRTHR